MMKQVFAVVARFLTVGVVTSIVEVVGALCICVGVGQLLGFSAALILGGVFLMVFAYLGDRA